MDALFGLAKALSRVHRHVPDTERAYVEKLNAWVGREIRSSREGELEALLKEARPFIGWGTCPDDLKERINRLLGEEPKQP